ncbi:hypothetical protein [Gallaecimonas mangrovi]|uniref:hypothetical protein n=1 Tax=Gallaecimonas mangrovi TaxID=2291597 RepID=UPI001867A83E|nr:hypothetical protein [Gallaecimonas mangrovi]
MGESFWGLFLVFCFGIACLGIGFTAREKDAGIVTMWIGTLAVLGAICYRILHALN